MDRKQLERKAAAWFDGSQPTPLSPIDLPAPLKQPLNASSYAPSVSIPTCSICGDVGWLSTGPNIGAAISPTLVECECGLIARRRAGVEQERKAERAKRYLGELRGALGKLADCTFGTFDARRPLLACKWNTTEIPDAAQRKCLSESIIAARLYAANPKGWLYLYGPPGAGKSHLAAAIANDLAKNGEAVAYASVPDLLAFVRRGMDDNSADDRFEGLRGVDVLILDDFGTENMTGWSVETMFRLIEERDKFQRATVITSNLHYDDLNPRIASRLAGMVRLIPMLVSDYRRLPR
jgi:DNA replication protein DnaC